MAIRNVNLWKSIDWFTIILYFILVTCGWLSICGATYDFNNTDFLSFSSHTGKQLVWIGCAVILAIILLNIEKKYYEMFSYPIYIAFILLLIVTIATAREINGRSEEHTSELQSR